MSARPRINPGDLFRAARHVQAEDPATLGRIAELLGLCLAGAGELPRLFDPPRQLERPEVPPAPQPLAGPTGSDAEFLSGANDAWAEPLALAPAVSLPAWFSDVPAYPPTGSARDVPELPQIPLLNPRWVRAILVEALARDSDDGDLDLDLLAEQMGTGAPLRLLPRRTRKRLHKRVRVLVDTHEAMAPFREDQRQLLAALGALLPRDLVDLVECDGCPLAGASPGELAATFDLPDRGATVLLLSDLGAGPRLFRAAGAPSPAWRLFVELLRRRRCPVVAFVPCDPGRLTAHLGRWMAVLPWRPETTSARVRSLRARLRAAER